MVYSLYQSASVVPDPDNGILIDFIRRLLDQLPSPDFPLMSPQAIILAVISAYF